MGEGDEIWTVKRALDWVQGYLQRKGDENPRVSSEWLVSEASGLKRIDLYLNPDRPLERAELDVLHDYVARRGAGEPLQYITGEAPFRYLSVKVRPGVLIPRPETEVLVSEALATLPSASKRDAQWNAEAAAQETAAVKALKERIAEAAAAQAAAKRLAEREGRPASAEEGWLTAVDSVDSADEAASQESGLPCAEPEPLLVADICTGTGCIACAIASERHDTRVIAVDIAPDAVALARENAEALGLSDMVKVIQGDLGFAVPERYMGRFDLVVSNPPYVPTSVLGEIPREVVDFEPTLALDGGQDGLDLFRRLAPWAVRALKPGCAFACELHETHLDAAARIAQECGFSVTRIVDDLAGRPRVLVSRL
ncbi:MAG: HemK/PrmC family methyltransferase [Eggerthellaceae bacterium]|nr:HemK/PrmC family methyltransferase [Eggerthellaceae bacterium]